LRQGGRCQRSDAKEKRQKRYAETFYESKRFENLPHLAKKEGVKGRDYDSSYSPAQGKRVSLADGVRGENRLTRQS